MSFSEFVRLKAQGKAHEAFVELYTGSTISALARLPMELQEMFLEKYARAKFPDGNRTAIEEQKRRWREEIRLGEITKATAKAEQAERRIESALRKHKQNIARTPRGTRRNSRYEKIDKALREFAEMRPRSHEEVFQALDDRQVRVPFSEPFCTAGAWLAGFRKDHKHARAWLSKAWSRLNLPAFRKGPKQLPKLR